MTISVMQAFLQDGHMPGNKYNNCNPSTPRTRLERLLREREIRKSIRSTHSNEETRDVNRQGELFGNDTTLIEGEYLGLPCEEEIREGVAARAFYDGCEKQDGRPSKQRLLVVANRLPVSAVRKGEDSWQLEISVGGLVSALLGKYILHFVLILDLYNPFSILLILSFNFIFSFFFMLFHMQTKWLKMFLKKN